MADPLVLLPGMNCSARLWAPVVDLLPAPSPPVVHEELDVPDLDRQVDALLERLPARFTLAGVSLGAIVAMALCRRAPGRVAGLCLVSTNARPPTPEQRDGWNTQLDALESGSSARQLQTELLPLLLRPGAGARLVEETLVMADETGERRLAAQLRLQTTRIDERPGLRDVRVPTTVIAGDMDLLCPEDRHTEIAGLVPAAELTMLPQTAHLAPLEAAGRVAAAMREWLLLARTDP